MLVSIGRADPGTCCSRAARTANTRRSLLCTRCTRQHAGLRGGSAQLHGSLPTTPRSVDDLSSATGYTQVSSQSARHTGRLRVPAGHLWRTVTEVVRLSLHAVVPFESLELHQLLSIAAGETVAAPVAVLLDVKHFVGEQVRNAAHAVRADVARKNDRVGFRGHAVSPLADPVAKPNVHPVQVVPVVPLGRHEPQRGLIHCASFVHADWVVCARPPNSRAFLCARLGSLASAQNPVSESLALQSIAKAQGKLNASSVKKTIRALFCILCESAKMSKTLWLAEHAK